MKTIGIEHLIKNVSWSRDENPIATTKNFKCECNNNSFYPSDEKGEEIFVYGDELSTNYCCTKCKKIFAVK